MDATGWIWCSTPRYTVALEVVDGQVVDCAPYLWRTARGRDARQVWRDQARAGADLRWFPAR